MWFFNELINFLIHFTLIDYNFWTSEEPEHLMNAYLALYPEAQDELIDFLVDQRMNHSEGSMHDY